MFGKGGIDARTKGLNVTVRRGREVLNGSGAVMLAEGVDQARHVDSQWWIWADIQAFLLLTQPCQCAVSVHLETTVEGLLLEPRETTI
jgi:hypothetical protein